MRGKIAKKLRNHVLEINADIEPEPTEKQVKNMIRRAKRMWKRDPRFKKAFSEYFRTGVEPVDEI